jgi:hypothetical protein
LGLASARTVFGPEVVVAELSVLARASFEPAARLRVVAAVVVAEQERNGGERQERKRSTVS